MTNVQQIEMFEDLIEKVQNVANAIPPANAVPDVESTDNGKVLKANYSEGTGSYDWEDESYPKPTSATNGQVLTADGAGSASWQNSQGGLPDYSQAEQGSVLATQYGGDLGWDRPENLMPSGSLVPDFGSASVGDVLTITEDKSGNVPAWVTPSGGGSNITKLSASNVTFASDGSGHAVTQTNAYTYYTEFVGNGNGLNAYVVFSNVDQTAEVRIIPITYCLVDKEISIGFDESLLPTSYNDCSLHILYYTA